MRAAVSGDRDVLRVLLAELTPVVRVRVARALYRHRSRARRRALSQEADDLVQEVFVELFENQGHVLRSWDPARGLSLHGFVRLVSDRTAGAILVSGVRTPWRDEPVDPQELSEQAVQEGGADVRAMSRDLAARVYASLRIELTPLAFRMFELLFVDELEVEAAGRQLAMRPDAVYAWRSRLTKTIRRLAMELEEDAVPPVQAAAVEGKR